MGVRIDSKVCPVCNATVFLDMDTCYNCMHSFAADDGNDDTTLVQKEGKPSADMAFCAKETPAQAGAVGGGAMVEGLFGEFLVELEGFLRDFLVNRKIDIKQL